MDTRAGFAAIVGAPNAGKSTLVNAVTGEKVSIVTHKIQTTRFNVRAIAMHDETQIVLIDTPGIFDAQQRLGRSMVHAAWQGAGSADLIVHVVDAAAEIAVSGGKASGADKNAVRDRVRTTAGLKDMAPSAPVCLVLNKIDLVPPEALLALTADLRESGIYQDVFMISATAGDGTRDLISYMAGHMPGGPYLYPPDQAADIPMRLMAAEITREKLFLRLHNELPYESHVETEKWTNKKDGSARIDQVIYVRRASQKPIVLGRGGRTIKQIGAQARAEMRSAFGVDIHLFLFVKVRAGWRDDPGRYSESGLEFDV